MGKRRVAVLLAALLAAPVTFAYTEVGKDGIAPSRKSAAGSPAQGAPGTQSAQGAQAAPAAPAGLPSANDYSATVLPELKGVVSWKTLGQVQPVKQGSRIVPEFSSEIMALDKKEGRFQGFMLPMDMGEKQKRFILTAVPPHCSFCLPAGPEAMVEVLARTPIRYGFEPIVVSGRLAVLKDDPTGVLYRVTDAVQVPLSQLK